MQEEDAKVSSPEEEQAARLMLFETLPILVYLDELWREVLLVRAGGQPGTGASFREIFCPKDERHHTLRRDFAKYDEQRFFKFRSFVLGEGWNEDKADAAARKQINIFKLIQRQLKEVA